MNNPVNKKRKHCFFREQLIVELLLIATELRSTDDIVVLDMLTRI